MTVGVDLGPGDRVLLMFNYRTARKNFNYGDAAAQAFDDPSHGSRSF